MLGYSFKPLLLITLLGLMQSVFANSFVAIKALKKYNPLLFQAAADGDRALVEDLLEIGVNPLIKNDAGLFPFHIAEKNNQPAIAAILLKAMRGKNGTDNKSWTPMQWAVLARDWDMLRELLREGARFRYRPQMQRGRTYQDPYDVARFVHRSEKFITIVQEEGRNDILLLLVEKAVSSGNYPIMLEELQQHGINLQTNPNAAERAIYTAVRQKKVDVARYLLEAGLHKSAYIGRGLLHHRQALYSAEMISLLLHYGANANEPSTQNGNPPLIALYSISRRYRPGSALVLLEHGADPNAASASTPPLLIIVEYIKRGYENGMSRLDDMKELLEYGADPNYRGAGGRRTLHELLKVYGSSGNPLDDKHIQKYIQTLLQYGANPNLEDAHGVSAHQYAQQKLSKELAADYRDEKKLASWQTLLEMMNTGTH